MNVTNRAEKSRREKWCHLSSFHVPFLHYGPYIVYKNAFLQFCAKPSKKSKSINAIYICPSERSRYALSENGIVYFAMT